MLNIVICTSDVDHCSDHLQDILRFRVPFRVTVLWHETTGYDRLSDLASGYPTVRWIRHTTDSFFSDFLFALYSDCYGKTLVLTDDDICDEDLISSAEFARLVQDPESIATDTRSEDLKDTLSGVVYSTAALLELMEDTEVIRSLGEASIQTLSNLWRERRLHV